MFNRTITAGLLAAAAAITPLRADVSQNLVDLRNSDYLSGTHIIYANDSGMTGRVTPLTSDAADFQAGSTGPGIPV